MSLLSIEWLKLKKYRTFWVLTGLFAVLLPLWNYLIASGILKMGGDSKKGVNLLDTAYTFPGIWGNLGFWAGLFVWFIAILVIIITTNEYTFRTHRQNIIDGWTRLQFFHGKALFVLILSVALSVYFFLLGAVMGGYYSHGFSNIMSGITELGYFFITCLDYLGFALLIAFAIRRSGLAIGLFLLYAMIIENIGKSIINSLADKPWGNLMPLQCSDELLPFPLMTMARSLMGAQQQISVDTYAITALCWCVIYYLLSRMLLLRRDW